MFPDAAWPLIQHSLKLRGRELRVVRGIFADATDLDIALRLGISVSAVHTYVRRLYAKLRLKNRPQLLLRVTCKFLTLTATPGNGLPPIYANRAARCCPLAARG